MNKQPKRYNLCHSVYNIDRDRCYLLIDGNNDSACDGCLRRLETGSGAVIPALKDDVRSHNVGTSDYAKHDIQPWQIWLEYELNPWDADIVKRVLRTKEGDSRRLDYEKMIHICQERIRQIDLGYK